MNRRSFGYNSCISCEDPIGVVESGTIRKHKSTLTHRVEHGKKVEIDRRKKKNVSNVEGGGLFTEDMVSGGVEGAQSRTAFQLLDVSREAQKLSHVVSSWSSGHSRSNSKDLAQDLLKGAIDLGESLSVLSSLQQSSKYMSDSTKNQKIERGWFDDGFDDLEMEGNDVAGLNEEMRETLTHLERRFSGSSRNSFEDIKKVILDGVGRKDVFSNTLREDACNAPPECFVSPVASKKKKKKKKKIKRSNLIAKLMGLEDASMRSLSYNQNRSRFDLDLPMANKCDYDPQNPGSTPTLDQMIEAVKFKGVPTSNSKFFHSKHIWDDNDDDVDSGTDDRPPIVILRPFRFSCLDLDQPIVPKPREDLFEQMILGMRIRTNPLAQTEESETLNNNAVKASSFGKSKLHKKQVVENNAEDTQRVSKRKGGMKGTSKSGNRSKSKDGDKQATMELKTSGGNCMEVNILPSDSAKHGRRGTKKSTSSEKNLPDNICKVESKIVPVAMQYADQRYRDQYGEVEINCGRESQDASQIEITVADYDDYDQSSPSETPLLFGNQRNRISANGEGSRSSIIDIEPIEDDNQSFSCSQSGLIRRLQEDTSFYLNSAPSVERLRALLLCNQTFIQRLEELFNLKVNSETYLLQQADDGVDYNDISLRVLLDAANELITLKGFRCSRASLTHQWTSHKTRSITWYSSSSYSLEHLLDEVCDELESLSCNTIDEGYDELTDSLLFLVKRDLRSTVMVGGMWDIGWLSAGSADEIEEITRGVDELILDGLIEEIFADLSFPA